MAIEDTLRERGERYGDFTDHARLSQQLQDDMRGGDGWGLLSFVQKQSLTVIADKIARILTGDPNYSDNWHDIQGYAKLAEDRCGETIKPLGSGWVEWSGGERPADLMPITHVRFRDGSEFNARLSDLKTYRWTHRPDDSDIIAYRVEP